MFIIVTVYTLTIILIKYNIDNTNININFINNKVNILNNFI